MDNYLNIANGPVVFLLCVLVVGFVMIQAVLFMRKAWKQGRVLGMDKGIMRKTIRSSGIFSIFPTLPIMIFLILLMPNLGGPFSWLRLSVIGSGAYENIAANATAQTFGLTSVADSGYTLEIFVSTMFVMAFGIMWGPLYAALGSKYIQKGVGLIKGKMSSYYSDVFAIMFISLVCVFSGQTFAAPFKLGQTGISGLIPLLVLITSLAAMFLLDAAAARSKKKLLSEFSFPLCLIIGMGSAILYSNLLG